MENMCLDVRAYVMYEDCTCSLFSFSPSLNNKGDSSYKLEDPFS